MSAFSSPNLGPRRLRAVLIFLAISVLLSAGASAQFVPPVPVPPVNPMTPQKAVLGKILFWDQQLSSDHSTACGTCHLTEFGGADPVFGLHPGADGAFGTPDDIHGSIGVVRRDPVGIPISDPVFGGALESQSIGPILNTVEMAKDGRWGSEKQAAFSAPPRLGALASRAQGARSGRTA
jgi:cytochrome c peroxidase